MPAYDSVLFNPPAPLARVTIRHSSPGATVSDVPMLLDTGADVTLLPQASVERLGIRVDSRTYGREAAIRGNKVAEIHRKDFRFCDWHWQ